MVEELFQAYEDTMRMLEDGIRKVNDDVWKSGSDDYLVPVRISYHAMMGLEWLVNELPEEEHKLTRRYNLNWEGPVEPMPGRTEMLWDLEWLRGKVRGWFSTWEMANPDSVAFQTRYKKALYYLRHTQHLVGEFSIVSRLLHVESPEWK
jgi:hypothetical protein